VKYWFTLAKLFEPGPPPAPPPVILFFDISHSPLSGLWPGLQLLHATQGSIE
jgi:hypothetical protein